jgi:glycosyltransferase involved in cell wall biosynthesis
VSRHLCLLGDASSVHLQRWAREMQARSYRVSIVTARPMAVEGIEPCVLPPVRRSTDWLFRSGATRRFVESLAPDIVHAHYVTSYGYLAACVARRPIVMTAWGSDLLVTPKRNPLLRALTGWTLRRADLITGDSNDLVEAARAYGPRAPVQRIHWGVDMDRFGAAPWADKSGFGIVSLRSWEPNYRIDVIVAACAQLLQHRPGVPLHLHLLGGGPQEQALRGQVQALGLQPHVSFHGRVGDAEMQAVMARCKVSVSVPESDATSVAMMESMACGLPVVASDLPANREWLSDADDLRVRPGDVAGLCAALATLADDDARARRLGQINRQRIEHDGRRNVQMDTMAALYERLLADGGGRAA